MIIRNGIVDRVVRYNGWPVQIRNRYNNVGYIPIMTSDTSPSPYVASVTTGGNYPYRAFDGDSNSFCNLNANTPGSTRYLQIVLDKPISIWKVQIISGGSYLYPASFFLAYGDNSKIIDVGSGTFIFSPTLRSQTYRLVIIAPPSTSADIDIFAFQIYPFD